MKKKKVLLEEQMVSFSRRALLVGGLQIGALGLIVKHLYNIQVSESQKYSSLSDEEISMAGDRYTYVYDKAASDATVASGRDGEVQLHFTVASGPANVGRTMALRDGHPLEAELRKQQRVLQDLERAEGGEEVTVADVEEDDDEQPDVQMESKKRSLKRSELRKMLQREAFRALTK